MRERDNINQAISKGVILPDSGQKVEDDPAILPAMGGGSGEPEGTADTFFAARSGPVNYRSGGPGLVDYSLEGVRTQRRRLLTNRLLRR